MGWLPCVGQLIWTYSITTGSTTNSDGLTNMCQWSKGHSPRMCGWSSTNLSILPEKQLSASFVEHMWVNSNIFTGERQNVAPDFVMSRNCKPSVLKGMFRKKESLQGDLN